jgi:TetR/AcrR family transcriptional regulator, transcriptional repressor for nem operon
MMKSNSNRKCIISAAMRLFGRCGYFQTSVGDIAEEAGMLKGNIAYYFKTKPELLESVLNKRRKMVFKRLESDGTANISAAEAISRLIAMVESSAEEMAASGCPVGSLAGELGKGGGELHTSAAALLLEIQEWLAAQFSRELPGIRAADAAEHLITLLQGAAVIALAHRDPDVVKRQMRIARQWLGDVLPGQNRDGALCLAVVS